jgi:para-nitrobenzyl esterase
MLATREMSAFTTVYGYEFTERDPVQEEPLPPITELPNAAYHTSEEAYVVNGNHDHAQLTGRAAALSAMTRAYWTTFARTGDPNGGGRPNWPRLFGSLKRCSTCRTSPA